MRRGVLILIGAVAAIGLFTGGLAWLLTDLRPPAGATRAHRRRVRSLFVRSHQAWRRDDRALGHAGVRRAALGRRHRAARSLRARTVHVPASPRGTPGPQLRG